MGLNEESSKEVNDCFFHEVVDAYELKNLYKVHWNSFDIDSLSLKDYYCYLKILDRADNGGGYSFSQRDRLFKEQLNYWYSVFYEIKPNAIVFSNLPHLLYDFPMYLIAKKLGIKTLMFNVMPFKGWYYLTQSLFPNDSLSNLFERKSVHSETLGKFKEQSVYPYENKTYFTPHYMKKQFDNDKKKKFLPKVKRVVRPAFVKFGFLKQIKQINMRNSWKHNAFNYYGASGFVSSFYYSKLSVDFKKNLIQNHLTNTLKTEKADEISSGKYVYVPLHYQPEATTAPLGGYFSDQIYMLEKLRAALPEDVSIIVKEHYTQFSDSFFGTKGRYLSYWEKINKLENTYIVPTDYDSRKLILNSLAVATVTGTAGWEAIQFNKHCIIFGTPWYESYPGLIRYDKKFAYNLEKVLDNIEPVDYVEDFLLKLSSSLVYTDLHSITNGEVPKNTSIVVDIIDEFCDLNKEGTVKNVN